MSTQMSTALHKEGAKLGFIGLGLMGSRFLRRLHTQGWNIRGWNRSKDVTIPLREYGSQIESTLSSLVAESDVLLSSLADDNAVKAVYLGDDGVLAHVRPQTILLEMSTISPKRSKAASRDCVWRNAHSSSLTSLG